MSHVYATFQEERTIVNPTRIRAGLKACIIILATKARGIFIVDGLDHLTFRFPSRDDANIFSRKARNHGFVYIGGKEA